MSRLSLQANCVLVVLLCVGHSRSADLDQHQLELKNHYEHLTYIAEFKCHSPQPRVIPVHKLFPDSQTHGKAYFPDVTVLHRCDAACGVCTSNHLCAPVDSTPTQLTFKVTFLEDVEEHKRGSWRLEDYILDNHTRCDCTSGLDSIADQWTGTFNYGLRPDSSQKQPENYQSQRPSSGGSEQYVNENSTSLYPSVDYKYPL